MSRKTLIAGLFVTVVGICVLLVANGRADPSVFSDPSHTGIKNPFERTEAELLVLRSDGFKPSEITRPPGRFLLALQNHSSEEELSLVLKQETGASVTEVRMSKRQSKFKEFLQLPPGRYVLVDANHPEWSCRITITP